MGFKLLSVYIFHIAVEDYMKQYCLYIIFIAMLNGILCLDFVMVALGI